VRPNFHAATMLLFLGALLVQDKGAVKEDIISFAVQSTY
jgi:hypothetical protein